MAVGSSLDAVDDKSSTVMNARLSRRWSSSKPRTLLLGKRICAMRVSDFDLSTTHTMDAAPPHPFVAALHGSSRELAHAIQFGPPMAS